MTNDIDLKSLIEEKLGFLLNDFKFTLIKTKSPREYYLRTSTCELYIHIEHFKPGIAIAPYGELKKKILESGTRIGRINIKIVSECLDKNYTYERLDWDAKVDLEKEFTLYADLIRKYCMKMIQGDFSQWPAIHECIRKRR
jgi:hypothetical protein